MPGLAAARTAIGEAEKAGAGHDSAPELNEAREKLAAAENAVSQKHMTQAAQLAEQARVEANLASARSGELQAAAINQDMKHSNDALGEELQRASGARP